MDRIIMHIDVNNAFLSWTALELMNKGHSYDIRNSYAVIGGDESARSGIVLAKSTGAKKLGIYTSETLYSARKKCPNLKIYRPNYDFYVEMSNKLFNLLSKYTPDIEVASIDECYLDYTKVKNLYGDPLEFAYKVRDEVNTKLGFTVNVGIANSKLCAKMASDLSKPNKVHTLFDNEIKDKMYPLDIEQLFGIGRKTSPKLRSMGIETIGDLANYDLNKLQKVFKNQGLYYSLIAQGIDDSLVVSEEVDAQCISNETTFSKDVRNKEELYNYLLSLVDNVSIRLRKDKKYAFVVAVILKDSYFRRKSHQKKLKNATNITNEIYECAKEILDEMYDLEPVRLIGVRLDGLVSNLVFQTSLFDDVTVRENSEILDQVIDEIVFKYGATSIKKASLIGSKVKRKY